MKIDKDTCHYVEYDGQEYIRLGPDVWLQAFGNSYETVTDCEGLEKEFQSE